MLKKKNSAANGFTLIELVIVIVIIGILSAIGTPIYRRYVRQSMASEGRALVSAVANSQRIYYSTNSAYLAVASTAYNATLDVDARMNRYFTAFTVTTAAGPSFTVTTTGAGDATGITVTLTQTLNTAPVINEAGL